MGVSVSAIFSAAEPAGGAAIDQVVIATAGAAVVTALLLWLCIGHRNGKVAHLTRMSEWASRISGLPAWAVLPVGLAGGALHVALIGMYWDISLHIDQGRDAGPLANPAHYLILAGLFGIFAAGVLAIALPKDGERPGPAPVRLIEGWYAPVGGLLMVACGGFALTGFPLDDMWHRLFGQDVTLWGPTHLMLIGGAGMSLIGMAVLLIEGTHERRAAATTRGQDRVMAWRKASLMGGLLIGLSTFQAEFDFGVPQFRMVLHPLMIAFAAAFALVAARLWLGRGGAVGAALFFLAIRGGVSLLVGPILGETTPTLPLYLPEALVIEAVALLLARRPVALGVAGGLAAGTVGIAGEWAWTQAAFPLPWTGGIVPEALLLGAGAGVAGGVFGALLGLGLRGDLPRVSVARPLTIAAAVVLAVCVADGLITDGPAGERALISTTAAGDGTVDATVRLDPDSGRDAAWVTATAWQGGGLHVDRLRRAGPGEYRTTEPIPVSGDWKALIRVHTGRQILGVPVRMPADEAIPVDGVALPNGQPREFTRDTEILQREQKPGVAGWLKVAGPLLVLLLALGFASALAWGVGRVGRDTEAPGAPPRYRERTAPPRRETTNVADYAL
jgi:hypothetical protein